MIDLKPVPTPQRSNKTTLSLRLDTDTFDALQKRADAVGISISEAVRQLINQLLTK